MSKSSEQPPGLGIEWEEEHLGEVWLIETLCSQISKCSRVLVLRLILQGRRKKKACMRSPQRKIICMRSLRR